MTRFNSQTALERLKKSGNLEIGFLSFVVGLVGGLGAILFRYLISGAQHTFFSRGGDLLSFLGGRHVILVPALGMVIVAFMVLRWAIEARGHGVPEVQYAVRKNEGRIKPKVALVKILASAVCIGSGGSVGREGPIVQIGSTFGSAIGQLMKLKPEHVRLLLACGAAAGIGGTFNAPIAGVLFALEVILADFNTRNFGFIVIASVTSTALCQAVLGKSPAFMLIEPFSLISAWEFLFYLPLGVFAGMIALVFVETLYGLEDLFEKWRMPVLAKAALGGLGVGLLGYYGSGYLFGVGYEGIERCLGGGLAVKTLMLLVVLKILATSLTLAAGGSGGVFAPSLFIGAMAGGAFGAGVGRLFPGICAPLGAYALVGMAAVFAGAAHAPITAIVILFEMTGDYKIILPLMLAVVVSYLLTSALAKDSIYSIKLRRRGGLVPEPAPTSIMDNILVADAMNSNFRTVPADMPVTDFSALVRGSTHRSFPVLGPGGELAGIVAERDLAAALMEKRAEGHVVADIMTRNLVTCLPTQNLRTVLEKFAEVNVRQIPVVDPANPRRLLGLLSRESILWAYGEMTAEYQRYLEEKGRTEAGGEGDRGPGG